MKEFIQTEVKAETAVLVALITKTQNEHKTQEYLDELAWLERRRCIASHSVWMVRVR